MPSRFEEPSEGSLSLTPEVAERVVARFLERQSERERAEVQERERRAEVARVQDLADLLGTTPDDVTQLAREVRQGTKVPEKALSLPALPALKPKWPLHLAYLTALGACLFWRLGQATRAPTFWAAPGVNPPIALPNGQASDVALRFDPYVGGYVRDARWMFHFDQGETPLVDPALKPPPPGLKVTLVTPTGRKSIAGVAGKTPDTPQAAALLREAIRSILAYEEATAKVEGSLPTVDYDKAAYSEGTPNWNGQPTYVGWHQIEVTDGRQTFRTLLPDRRYAKDIARFQKAFDVRLASFADTKFFPSQPPANLRPGARQIGASAAIPKGVALMVWDDRQTVWLRGEGAAQKIGSGALGALIDTAASNLNAKDIPRGILQIAAIYPGGESYSWWPTHAAEGGDFARREEKAKELADQVADAYAREAKPPSRERVVYGGGSTPPTRVVETHEGTFAAQDPPPGP